MVYVRQLDEVGMGDLEDVGGKNASLGEMIGSLAGAGVSVPGGFATTAAAFREFLRVNDLQERIDARLRELDVADVVSLAEVGKEIRDQVASAPPARAPGTGRAPGLRRAGAPGRGREGGGKPRNARAHEGRQAPGRRPPADRRRASGVRRVAPEGAALSR